MKNFSFFFFLLLMTISNPCLTQNTYQKIFEGVGHSQNFDTRGTRDGGIITTGILDDGENQRIFVSKLDCQGVLEWTKLYHNSSTIGNTGSQILVLPNGGYLLVSNIGTFQNYNSLLVRMDDSGNTIWQKVMIGSKDDVLRNAIIAPDGGFVVVGATNSYGEDQNSNILSYRDVYVAKLSSEGEAQWAKTFGTSNTIDEAYAITNTQDGGYALTGRYLDRGAFQVLLLKLDEQGEMEFIQTYGDSLSRNYAYDILQDPEGNYLISGSTTLQKNHFNDPPDAFLLKASASGAFLWARNYLPLSSDHSDSGASLVALDTGYAIAVPSSSFNTPGVNVQNKFVVLRTDLDGHLQYATAYTEGYSHYPKLSKSYDQSTFVLGGFSTAITTNFSPHLIHLNANFEGGCSPKNLLSDFLELETDFIPNTPNSFSHEGANWSNTSFQPDSLNFETWILCQSINEACTAPLSTKDLTTASSFQIFPNPVRDKLSLSLEAFQQKPLHLDLINSTGQILSRQVINPNQTIELNVANLVDGIYQVRIWNDRQWGIESFVKLSVP